MKTETIIEVTEDHIDSLGHLNHVQAVRFLEKARDEWLAECGLFDTGSGTRYGSIVVNVNYNYKKECFLGERVRVVSRPLSMGSKSYTLAHEIIKANGEVAIDGQATSVIMDMNQRAIIQVPPCMATHLPKRA